MNGTPKSFSITVSPWPSFVLQEPAEEAENEKPGNFESGKSGDALVRGFGPSLPARELIRVGCRESLNCETWCQHRGGNLNTPDLIS